MKKEAAGPIKGAAASDISGKFRFPVFMKSGFPVFMEIPRFNPPASMEIILVKAYSLC